MVKELIPIEGREATLGANRCQRAHHAFFWQRLLNSTVHFGAHDGDAYYIPQVGNCIGSAEGPRFSARAFNKFVQRWWCQTKVASTDLVSVHPAGGTVGANLVVYADDVGEIRLVETGKAD